ncbi:ankyrin repeat domain-containing protein [Fusarium pseudoanthophilum]|uniref:Ankyrin repeat domain-containing protein n=1 Tax=Fusarium pseudoanthophilum TaxID=48495 RepID=A0A8H5Q712_9HYPO|nr:ankyrin repeat domain-containing protein [Fusarium pseudoanthophilum]
MESNHTPGDHKPRGPGIPVTSALGQALRREEYSNDGEFVNKEEALPRAILEKQTDFLKAILKDGLDINLKLGKNQTTPLQLAAAAGSCDLISTLKDAGANLEEKDADGSTPLFMAVHNGHDEAAQLLCDLGANIECRSNVGFTPLHHAAGHGHLKIIQLLFDRNVNLESRDDGGMTPLSVASNRGEFGAVQLLVQLGADISVEDKNGDTTLHHAVRNDYTEILVLSASILYEAKHAVNLLTKLEDIDVNQQYHPSVMAPLLAAAKSGSLEIARLLIEHGAILEVTDNDKNTPLHYASACGHMEMARFLLDKGADIESRNNIQQTPFLVAAVKGKIVVIRMLAEYGADREAKDKNGYCALHYAALNTNNLLLRCLLELGVDMEVGLYEGLTALVCAAVTGKTDIVTSLLEFGANTTAKGADKCTIPQRSLNDQVIACVKHGNLTQLKRLLDAGADINVLSTSCRSALSVAAEYGHRQLVDFILQIGGFLDLQDSNGESALWWASRSNHVGVVQRLLELGAQVDLPDSDGNSPLCVACQNNLVDIAECLLKAGGNPNGTTHYGMTPLLLSVNANRMKLLALIINKGSLTLQQIRHLPSKHSHTNGKERLEDFSERGVQVSLMSEIYSKATSVLMWIGEAKDHSDLAFDSMPVLCRAIEEIQKSPKSTVTAISKVDQDLLLGIPEIRDLAEQQKVDPQTWNAWRGLCKRSYFTRAWIFQEIILAGPRGTVICGPRQCSWDTFNAALKAYRALDMDTTPRIEVEAIIQNDYTFRLNQYLSLDIALWAMSSFKAGNPRDKVFAALGLAHAGGESRSGWEPIPAPKADYNQSVDEVFIYANRYIISLTGHKALWHVLDPFNQFTADGKTEGLPSWAFDFSKLMSYHYNPFPAIFAENTEYGTLLRGRPMATQTSLYVSGYVVDVVKCKVSIAKDKSTVDIVKSVVSHMADLGRGVYDPSPGIGKHRVSGSDEKPEETFSKTNLATLLSTLMRLQDISTDEKMKFAAYVASHLMIDNKVSEMFNMPPDYFRDAIEACNLLLKEVAGF